MPPSHATFSCHLLMSSSHASSCHLLMPPSHATFSCHLLMPPSHVTFSVMPIPSPYYSMIIEAKLDSITGSNTRLFLPSLPLPALLALEILRQQQTAIPNFFWKSIDWGALPSGVLLVATLELEKYDLTWSLTDWSLRCGRRLYAHSAARLWRG